MNNNPYQAVIPAPFGALGIRVAAGKLVGVEFLLDDSLLRAPADDVTQSVCRVLSAYLSDASAPLRLPMQVGGSAFQQRVWQALQSIPVGTTLTYTELAERVGSGPRAVANACGANPVVLVIPCHRVVAKSGLGGFMKGHDSGSLSIKQWLLRHERRNPTATR